MIKFMLDPKSGIPFYRQIIDQIRYGIATGRLAMGEQLPTARSLAVELKINLNTVIKAYKELEIQNILETQQGTGTFIGIKQMEIPLKEKQNKLRTICDEFITLSAHYGFSIPEMIDELTSRTGGNKT
jgi:GntR family transcriptional regulator